MSRDNDGSPPLSFDDAPEWLRAYEAAALARVSDRTIRRWVALRLLRASRPARGRLLIDRDSLRDLIEDAVA